MARTIRSGNLSGSTDATQLPDYHFQNGLIKAHPANGGYVAIGSSSDVELPGTTDTNTTGGYVLKADGVYLPGSPGSLSEFWYICTSSTDTLSYIIEDW